MVVARAALGCRRGHLDDPVEACIPENVVNLRSDVDQPQACPRAPGPLLGQQKDAKPRAGDVFEPGKVDDPWLGQRVEESQCRLALRGVEPPRHHDLTGRTKLDLEHRVVLLLMSILRTDSTRPRDSSCAGAAASAPMFRRASKP